MNDQQNYVSTDKTEGMPTLLAVNYAFHVSDCVRVIEDLGRGIK
jgi:hypothetical protein